MQLFGLVRNMGAVGSLQQSCSELVPYVRSQNKIRLRVFRVVMYIRLAL